MQKIYIHIFPVLSTYFSTSTMKINCIDLIVNGFFFLFICLFFAINSLHTYMMSPPLIVQALKVSTRLITCSQCEKLRKKRSSLVGAFVSTHGKSIDDVDRSIVEARTALNEVTQELQVQTNHRELMKKIIVYYIFILVLTRK